MRNEHDIDQEIKDALHRHMVHTKPPLRADQAWDQLQTKRRMQKIVKRKKMAGMVMAAAILFFMLSITFPDRSSAFFNVTTIFHKVQDSVVQLFAGNGEKSSIADPEIEKVEPDVSQESESSFKEFATIEEVQTLTSDHIIEPTYVPNVFELVNIQVFMEKDSTLSEVYLQYESDEKSFVITQIEQNGSLGFNGSMQSEEEHVREVDINGYAGNVIESNQDEYILIWFTPSYYLSIEGNIPTQEMEKIARSIQAN